MWASYFLYVPTHLSEGTRVLDVGCGVGGPARNIARFSGAEITGVTINEYQVSDNEYQASEGAFVCT